MKKAFKMLRIIIALVAVMGLAACSNNSTEAEKIYKVGEAGPGGGIVFYDKGNNSNGWRYLEAAPGNVSANYISWSSTIKDVTTGTGIGDGKANTAAIIKKHPGDNKANNAAHACVAYRGPNNLTDWFLPSKDEIYKLYETKGYGTLEFDEHLSSSQHEIGIDGAWGQDFVGGGQYFLYKDSADFRVRAIRAF